MSIVPIATEFWEFNRQRTLATIDEIAKLPDPIAVLGWRPAPGRAHIAWQMMHVGITEELFATSRLRGTQHAFPELVPRFKGGSTPDDDIPSIDLVKQVLSTGRAHLLETTATLAEADLETIPEAFKERGWTIATILKIIAWHEAHHQGQAHITLNLWKAANRPA